MNKKFSRAATATALAAAAALTLTACVMPFNTGGNNWMMGGDDDTNAADIMFVQMMIPHHEQAIEMSEIILAKDGVDPEVASLAEQIQAAQDPEITLMEQWLDDWGLPSMRGIGGTGHGGMDGMMSDAQMAELESATGADGSTLFLELMIEHHEGAIVMADYVIDDGRSADVRELAEQIVTSQTAEIETMNRLLSR